VPDPEERGSRFLETLMLSYKVIQDHFQRTLCRECVLTAVKLGFPVSEETS
jgi:hypothetical protein